VQKIKWSHLAILIMMTMGGLMPFLMMAADAVVPWVHKKVRNTHESFLLSRSCLTDGLGLTGYLVVRSLI
jgi:hypothetical protein